MATTIPGDTLIAALLILGVFAVAAIALISLCDRIAQDPPDAAPDDDLPDTDDEEDVYVLAA